MDALCQSQGSAAELTGNLGGPGVHAEESLHRCNTEADSFRQKAKTKKREDDPNGSTFF